MKIRGWTVLTAILAAMVVCAGAPAQTTIPTSKGTSLAGTPVGLPDALRGRVGVLVVGFSHASQGQVASWGKRLDADYGKSQDVLYLELPMLAGAPKMIRGMIVKSMAKSVPAGEKAHMVPMTEGEPAWRAVAHYDKPDDAYVMLVDGTGTVRWQTEGEATDVVYSEMKKNLSAVSTQK